MDHLEPFDPPNNLKNQNFEKMKKTPEDILHLHKAGKISFSGARKSVLLKASSGEHCAPCDFMRYTCSPHCVPCCAPNEIYYGKMK